MAGGTQTTAMKMEEKAVERDDGCVVVKIPF